jgi:hypothetical protein
MVRQAGEASFGAVRYGEVWSGLAGRAGLARQVMVRLGVVRFGQVSFIEAGRASFVVVWSVVARFAKARRGSAGRAGMVGLV